MYKTIRTNSDCLDFQKLVQQLDLELAIRDGDDHEFYSQINKTAELKFTVLIYENEKAIGCGALKIIEKNVLELKRIFVPLEQRGKGIATIIVNELEKWANELNYEKLILETGINQPEAINLYKKMNYKVIPNYGQYAGIETSVCFEKNLNSN